MEEKQNKVIGKINHTNNCGQTTPLGTKKNDECYTDPNDIFTEFEPWANLNKFKGKDIICPCDWDIVGDSDIYSITITYKEAGVDVFGNTVTKAAIEYELWDDTDIKTIKVDENAIDEFLRDKLTCNFLRVLTQNARNWGIRSITASGYNPRTGKGTPFQDIDYSKYQLCCTNPPFSLYPEFMQCMMKNKHLDFIVLAPATNRTNPSIGVPLMTRRAYLGWNLGNMSQMTFINPTADNNYEYKTVCCDWLTSFPEAQDGRNLKNRSRKTNIDYNLYKDHYMVMVNMHMKDGDNPIKVPASEIPDNYDGWMFSSSYVLDFLDFDNYEWYGTNFARYFNKNGDYYKMQITDTPIESPFITLKDIHKGVEGEKGAFAGIVFRRKTK